MARDPDGDGPRFISRTEVKQVDYQIEVLARRIAEIDKAVAVNVAVSSAELERLRQDVRGLSEEVGESALLTQRLEQVSRDADRRDRLYGELKQELEKLRTELKELSDVESERRGSRNQARAIVAVVSASIGGLVGTIVNFLLQHR